MAGICRYARPSLLLPRKRVNGFKCCSGAPNGNNLNTTTSETPQLLKVAVSGVTELLRLFSPAAQNKLDTADTEYKDEISVSNIDDILSIIKSDYEKAYFVTGLFTSGIYAEDCIFEDPTIRFRGRELYSRNLKLLVPFFEEPSIELKKIEKGINSEREFIVASWKLRTYLKLPWRPCISVDGSTVYDSDAQSRIVRHAESWNISALEAVGQIFTPSFGSSGSCTFNGEVDDAES